MGWSAYYQLRRHQPLVDTEIAAVERFVTLTNVPRWDSGPFGLSIARTQREDGVVAFGSTKLVMNVTESLDHRRLLAALERLVQLIPGSEVSLRDDLGILTRGPTPLTLEPGADASFVRIVVPLPPPRSVESADPVAFLQAWRDPEGARFYDDLSIPDEIAETLSRIPEVEAQLRADLEAALAAGGTELMYRRGARAARLLGVSRSRAAARTLIAAARSMRGRDLSIHQSNTTDGIYTALVSAGVSPIVPTLLLYVGDARLTIDVAAARVLAKLAPARVLPVLRHLAGIGRVEPYVIEALEIAGDEATLEALCSFPLPAVRKRVAAAFQRLGRLPPNVEEPPPPEELLTHRFASVRDSALKQLEKRDDPALMTSILAAKVLGTELAISGRVGAYGKYLHHLPESLRHRSHPEQLRAVLAGEAPSLPQQIVLPCIEPILRGDLAELLERCGAPPRFALDPAAVAALVDEEAAELAALA